MKRNGKSSLLLHGLFVRRPLLNFFLRCWNRFCIPARSTSLPANPQKILLANIAHFGDVVISTAVLPALKRRFPKAEFHFLTATLTKCVVERHPFVTRVYTLDHWVLSRGKKGLCKAALHSWRQSFRLRKELQRERYDLAIDLYPYFPNAIRLLAASKIPFRVGYISGGFGALFTHPFPWVGNDQYMAQSQLDLLKPLGINPSNERPLPFLPKQERLELDYVVVHMGSSKSHKEWSEKKWIELIQCLRKRVVLTGQGEREQEICNRVATVTGAENRCNELKWQKFVETIHNAALLISVDSAAVHIAAAQEIPTVALYTGINPLKMWLPSYSHCIGLMAKVPCAPCLRKKGCLGMDCIREIEVKEVLRAIEQVSENQSEDLMSSQRSYKDI